ncbi:chemotaxis protein CheA [Herbaspirillum sp. AP02]|uniref:chemotaxis protein CheA n=1 Tax=unclassified Herbaspirillum TaxID=2624150 RepID=UPI0015DB1604|nr:MULTISPECIES: chemotaxis protein CheA [unclassified Herbaspirillum]MBG7621618.1 chemotaxis protein CheA [Herbaspirillum sp. AP02]NZD69705.1 chemotaxis protein CheA [Herbaspirillum sp. AP21]
MTLLRDQFISETRDLLQGISEKLMQLEDVPEDVELLESLFRMVHTLKGNSGLFDVPEMTRVLHAGEDLMDAVRRRQISYSEVLADRLLDAMDFVAALCDGMESDESGGPTRVQEALQLSAALRELIADEAVAEEPAANHDMGAGAVPSARQILPLSDIPESLRIEAFREAHAKGELHWVAYHPAGDCFFQGDDPFYRARNTPGCIWGAIQVPPAWPPLVELNAYDCVLRFQMLVVASHAELMDYYRYVPDQVAITSLDPPCLVVAQGEHAHDEESARLVEVLVSAFEAGDLALLHDPLGTALRTATPGSWLASALRWLQLVVQVVPGDRELIRKLIGSMQTIVSEGEGDKAIRQPRESGMQADLSIEEIGRAIDEIFAIQQQILQSEANMGWQDGRTQAVASTLMNCCSSMGCLDLVGELEIARQQALQLRSCEPLLTWLNTGRRPLPRAGEMTMHQDEVPAVTHVALPNRVKESPSEEPGRAGRRAEDSISTPRSVKVEQVKIDRLMNLIGEMVVSKNALPYLAQRAEDQFRVRELSREIKAQYAVINRIAEEMQDAIMQVRMMPVSVVFQRFPRLVRDISRKLGKEVQLVLEGEETQADKNIIEALADPLIHIVRNSLDHGLEEPGHRRSAGKPAIGTLTISAAHQGDQVVIVIQDDGRGIDPALVKRKAYEKGLIDEVLLERMSDQEAVNLVFASGFSTAEVVSDLSGRGVGMDVVRNAVEKINGSISLQSMVGKGTRLQISLPLSMAVTKVMIIESHGQLFGVPMEHVMETVRIPRSALNFVKRSATMVLRGHVLGLKSINQMLSIPAEQKTNADDEVAVLVVRVGGQSVGLIIDDFREAIDVIQKPLVGILGGLSMYSGSALMGDGSVLMVLNAREMF